ncbi:hypothetical protein GCM10010451_15260 [Streptomyces virens]|uniref:Lantibiotic dehydratase N-terminal domain-containing protein n=1 Tax=Streptomyces virens TaxID=285572 RepID=A0ABP6P4V7_9ACTN|nr:MULTISPECIES: lantibiotic dehydratase [Streptomyces]MBA8975919.1 hypothetical protein [Streptomyces calvus]MYS31564.1 hypothetical protein [Streptomyces sp. SID7804]
MNTLKPRLLRIAGLPVHVWTEGGSPSLFDQLAKLESLEAKRAEMDTQVAEDIGEHLVPLTVYDRRQRWSLLNVRRILHRGENLSIAQWELLEDLAGTASLAAADPAALRNIRSAAELGRACAVAARELDRMVEEEHLRLLRLPWDLLQGSMHGRLALAYGAISGADDIRKRLRRGEPWTGKELRRRSDYLWRMIARGAVKTTPRSWLGHVAPVDVSPAGHTDGHGMVVTDAYSVTWMENLYLQRNGPADAWADRTFPGSTVGLAPLVRMDAEYLTCWGNDPANPARVTELRLRSTRAMRVLFDVLRQGALTVQDIEASVLPSSADAQERSGLRDFLAHLVSLGALTSARPVRQNSSGWMSAGELEQHPRFIAETGYTDVYRKARCSFAMPPRLPTAVDTALRLMALVTGAGARRPDIGIVNLVTEMPQAVPEVLARHSQGLSHSPPAADAPGRTSWPKPSASESGYKKLTSWIDSVAPTDGRFEGHIDITSRILDAFGIDDPPRRWPVDVTLRLGTRCVVLDNTAPSGVLTARFADSLARMHDRVPFVDDHRSFIRNLDDETGIRSVELMLPSQNIWAANAVRRPLYTSAWTGDSSLDLYCHRSQRDITPSFVPLGELLVSRDSEGALLVTTAAGERVRIVYHATRTPLPPWDALTGLLLHGSPQFAISGRSLRCSLMAFPRRRFLPRITVEGVLVVSAAQWRVTSSDLWPLDASRLHKARLLYRMRRDRFLPRWVFVSPAAGASPVPCDLESLRAISTMEHAMAMCASPESDGMVIEEMIPDPSEFRTVDLSDPLCDRVATEVLLATERTDRSRMASRDPAKGGRKDG